MARDDDERLLRTVALRNAESILLARQRAEEELIQAKEGLELKTQELARSLAIMRATLESTTDGILVTTASHHVTAFNEKFVEMWAVPAGVMSSRDHRRILEVTSQLFNDGAQFLARIDSIYASSPPESYDLLERADGRVFERYSRIQFVDEQNVGRVWSFRDITEPMRAESALRRSERELADFFDNASVGLHWVGPDGTILRVNRTELDMLGYGRDEYLGRRIAEFHVEQDVITDILAQLARGGTVTSREARLRCKDGSIRTVLINSNGLWEDGQFVHSRCFTQDVTAQREAEARSRQLAAIVESTDDAIVSKDLNGIVNSWNRAAEWVFGYTADEMIGQPVRLLIPTDRADEEAEILGRIADGGRVDSYETVRRRKDGQLIPVSLNVSPIIAADGRIVGASKIARDISQQKQAEEALREADRRKSEFLALLAHELRNPLAAIQNALQILAMTEGGKPVVGMMQRQVGQSVRLIDDLLDVSRISRGKMELRRDRIELLSIIHDAVEAARPGCDRLAHMLTVNLPSQPIYVYGDPDRLTQVVGNLLDNACKFTPRGGRISLTVAQEGEAVVLRIRDSGIGIAAEHIDQIFEIFMQVDTSLERSQSGLGLGLTLAKNLVEMHGGTIEVHSDGLAKGSEFIVGLPGRVDTPPQQAERTKDRAAVLHRILIVDDNRDSADSLAALLALSGHAVRVGYDGIEAVQTATEFRPDVILLDIGLPNLNGYEAARMIRTQAGGRTVLLLALTGWGQDADRRRSEEAGFDAHLVKPVDYAALTKILADWPPPT